MSNKGYLIDNGYFTKSPPTIRRIINDSEDRSNQSLSLEPLSSYTEIGFSRNRDIFQDSEERTNRFQYMIFNESLTKNPMPNMKIKHSLSPTWENKNFKSFDSSLSLKNSINESKNFQFNLRVSEKYEKKRNQYKREEGSLTIERKSPYVNDDISDQSSLYEDNQLNISKNLDDFYSNIEHKNSIPITSKENSIESNMLLNKKTCRENIYSKERGTKINKKKGTNTLKKTEKKLKKTKKKK